MNFSKLNLLTMSVTRRVALALAVLLLLWLAIAWALGLTAGWLGSAA